MYKSIRQNKLTNLSEENIKICVLNIQVGICSAPTKNNDKLQPSYMLKKNKKK